MKTLILMSILILSGCGEQAESQLAKIQTDAHDEHGHDEHEGHDHAPGEHCDHHH